jgi:exopolysaccharide production protein ExoQ
MTGREQASRLEMYYAAAMLVFASGVAYMAFVPQASDEVFVKAGDSIVYSSLWLGGYLILALLVGQRIGGVIAVFARNWPVLILLFSFLLPEILESYSWSRLLLLFCTVTFCAWMASRFSLTQTIMTLGYVFAIVMVLHALSAFVHPGYIADPSERDTLLGSAAYGGLFSHKQQAGIVFSTSFVFYSLLILTSRASRKWKVLGAATSLLFLLLSGSVNGILVTLATLDASLCLWALIRARMYIFYIGVSTSIVTAVILIVDSDLVLGALGRSSDLTGRTDLWQEWPRFFYDRLLTGYGYSGFFVEGGPAERLWDMAEYFHAPNFHNSFLDVGIQAGAPGMLSLTLIVVLGLAGTCMAACKSRQPAALVMFGLFLDVCLFGSGEGALMAHNNFVTFCFLTIYFRSGFELRLRATSRYGGFTAFGKRDIPVSAQLE